MASAARNEWEWVNSHQPADTRPLLWRARRACINAGVRNGKQVGHAEQIAASALGISKPLSELAYGELWRLIDFLERP